MPAEPMTRAAYDESIAACPSHPHEDGPFRYCGSCPWTEEGPLGGFSDETPSRRIYVASSWRNERQPLIVETLRGDGHEVYDFKQPHPGNFGFHWSDVGMPSYDRATNSDVPASEYLRGIQHPIAQAGFKSDFDAMKWADRCVLVLPSGRSAHLEAGWFIGQGRPTAILLEGQHMPVTPELMYLMADLITGKVNEVRDWLTERAS